MEGFVCGFDDGPGDGLAFCVEAGENGGRCCAFEDVGELPGEVVGAVED